MSDEAKAKPVMGDLIGSTRQRLETASAPDNPSARLQALVAATPKPKAIAVPQPEAPAAEPPANYFAQVAGATAVTPKRTPKKGPTRSLSMTMRLSAPERDRFVRWCDDRNLSLADGVMALLDMADSDNEPS